MIVKIVRIAGLLVVNILLLIVSAIVVGCDDQPSATVNNSGPCQDSVKILTPNPASSANANEHTCPKGAKLKVTDKDQSIVALCRCPENAPPASDAGVSEEKK